MALQWQFNLLVIPLALSLLVVISLIAIALRKQSTPIILSFLTLMVCIAILIAGSLLEVMTPNLQLSLVAADISLVGSTFMSVSWFSLVMAYNDKTDKLRSLLPWLIVIPILDTIMIATNSIHQLWRGVPYRDLTTTWFPFTDYNYGIWYYAIHSPYAVLLSLLTVGLLIYSIRYKPHQKRRHAVAILIAFLLPFSVALFHLVGVELIPHYNAAMLVFPISGFIIGWIVLEFRFLDVSPIARDLVLEKMTDLMVVLDVHGQVIDLNSAAYERLFSGSNQVLGRTLEDLLPALSEPIGNLLAVSPAETDMQLQQGEHLFSYHVRVSSINRSTSRVTGYLVLWHDITEQKQSQAESYQQAQQIAVLKERQRLARDLHDSVNQTLFAASTIADLLPRAIEHKPEKLPHYATSLQQLLQGTMSELRLVLFELYPQSYKDADLALLLKQLCQAFAGHTGISVNLSFTDYLQLDDDIKINFFRIAQEALNNINKHADATQVDLKLSLSDGVLEMRISDDGQGFDIGVTKRNHLGLKNMVDRAESIGAKFTIQSDPATGTAISVTRKLT